jgi:hypothetical protein
MATHQLSDRGSGDFLKNPMSAAFWWALPLAAGWSSELLPISPMAESLVWAAALAWMGTGCTLNARRCGRLHCYFSAPALFLGAIATIPAALGWSPLGPHTASDLINGALALALLSFLVEPIWGKYRTPRS